MAATQPGGRFFMLCRPDCLSAAARAGPAANTHALCRYSLLPCNPRFDPASVGPDIPGGPRGQNLCAVYSKTTPHRGVCFLPDRPGGRSLQGIRIATPVCALARNDRENRNPDATGQRLPLSLRGPIGAVAIRSSLFISYPKGIPQLSIVNCPLSIICGGR